MRIDNCEPPLTPADDDLDEALIQYHSICALHAPSKHDYNTLCHWYHHPRGGDQFLQHFEGDAFHGDEVLRSDLVSMSGSHRERDAFTMFLLDNVMTWWHRGRKALRRVCLISRAYRL